MAALIGSVDQVVRHQVVGFGLAQALLDGALDTDQTGAELVLGQFADRNGHGGCRGDRYRRFRHAIAQFDQNLDDINDVARRQGQLFANFDVGAERLQLGGQRFGFGQWRFRSWPADRRQRQLTRS